MLHTLGHIAVHGSVYGGPITGAEGLAQTVTGAGMVQKVVCAYWRPWTQRTVVLWAELLF